MQATFTFAGFTFPRAVVTLPKGKPASRKGAKRICGPYMTAPDPNDSRAWFFYLGSDFSPSRWFYADECADARIRHTGWFTDDQCGETIRGIVVRLSHGRMLAGWSMGEDMASEVESGRIFTDEIRAARYADECARVVAEREREYREAESALQSAKDDAEQLRGEVRGLIRDLRQQKTVGPLAPGLCERMQWKVRDLLEEYREAMSRMTEAAKHPRLAGHG